MSDQYGRYDWMWNVDKAIAFFLIFGFGGFTLISHIFELVTTNKLRRRLGLKKWEFQMLVIAFQITGMYNGGEFSKKWGGVRKS
jgi:hypothetical protein